MKHSLFIISIAASLLGGCKDDGVGPSPIPTSGRAIITTRYVDNKPTGFSFSLAGTVTIPNGSNASPDLLVLVQTDQSGNVVGVFFSAGPWRPAFRLLHNFSSSDSARSYFNGLAEVPDSFYTELAIPVRQNQIWAVKTHDSKYAKMQILGTVAYDSTSGTLHIPYGEAAFDWAYQPNGSRQF